MEEEFPQLQMRQSVVITQLSYAEQVFCDCGQGSQLVTYTGKRVEGWYKFVILAANALVKT